MFIDLTSETEESRSDPMVSGISSQQEENPRVPKFHTVYTISQDNLARTVENLAKEVKKNFNLTGYPSQPISLLDTTADHIIILYIWAILNAQLFFKQRDVQNEQTAHKKVDEFLKKFTCDFHSDPRTNGRDAQSQMDAENLETIFYGDITHYGCTIDVYDRTNILSALPRADHVFPKRRSPQVHEGYRKHLCDKVVGEGKIKDGCTLSATDTKQIENYWTYLDLGLTKAVVHWMGDKSLKRTPNTTKKMTWKDTYLRVFYGDPNLKKRCEDQLAVCGVLHMMNKEAKA